MRTIRKQWGPMILAWGCGLVAGWSEVVLEDGFSGAGVGVLDAGYVETVWGGEVHTGVEEGRVAVVEEGGNRFVRVSYPEGELGLASGASWKGPLPGTEEAVAEYRFRFEEGFDWTEGGKLPGMAGGTAAVGGFPDPAGFTARYMWTWGGNIFLYLYHSEQAGQFGDGIRLDNVWAVAGQWHTLKQRVKLNTPGLRNGEIQVWFDGRLVLDRRTMRWRLDGHQWKIDDFYFSTFHGGGAESYRPKRTNHVDFDDFVVEVVGAVDKTDLPPDPGTAVLYDVSSAAVIGTTAGVNLPLQTIDAVASGPGAVGTVRLESLPGRHINANWQDSAAVRFAVAGELEQVRNYLAFSGSGGEGVRVAVRFVYDKGGATSSKYVGGYNSTGADIVVTAGNSLYLGQALNPAGATFTITFGGYGTLARNETILDFREGTVEGGVYAVRAAGFILSGIGSGQTMTASFYGTDGRLLAKLEGLSQGETVLSERAGAEIFFGHDAGPDKTHWIHRIEIHGSAGGNLGFDDFSFTPVAAVVADRPQVVTRPTEVWWGSYKFNEQLVDSGANQWNYVQQEMDGYLLHGAYWNYSTNFPSPDVVGPKLAALLKTYEKPVIIEHLLAGEYPNIDSAIGYAFAGTLLDAAGYGSAIRNIRRLMGYGFPQPDVSTDFIMTTWQEAVRWHPEWTGEAFFTALAGNWETYGGSQFEANSGSPDRQKYGWFRQWVERLADAFPGIRVTATNSPVYFPWEEDGLVRRELGGSLNNFHAWVKLERRGDSVKALYSGDGYGWAELGGTTVPLGESARAGLFTASGAASLAEGRFENVTVLPFFTADIGQPGRGGKVSASGGLFTLEGNGDHGLHPGYTSSDAHYFVYREWTGDGIFTARLYSLSNSNPNRTNPSAETPTAGITLRSSTDAFARQVSLHANLANQLELVARTNPYGGLADVAGSGSPIANAGVANGARYLRLTRAGNLVTAAHSLDGTTWTTMGSVSVDLGATFLVGLVADSQVSFERCTAGFTSVSFLENPVSSFSGSTIGSAGAASSTFVGGNSTIRSAGSGVGGTADNMRFLSTSMTGDGTIIARLQYFADAFNTSSSLNSRAQMGLCLRSGIGAGDPEVAVVFTPQAGLKALARGSSNGTAGLFGSYGAGECSIEPLGAQRRPLLHYRTGNDFLRSLHEAFPGDYTDNFAGFTTDSPYAGYQKWGGSETHPDAILHREKILLYERWLQAQGREHQFIANSAGGTDFNGFDTSTQAGRDAWDALYKEHSLRSIQLHQLEGGRPDKVIFESWYAGPFSLVPETKAGSFTNLVREGILYLKGEGQVLDLSIAPFGTEAFGGAGFQQQEPSNEQRVVSLPGLPGTVQRWTIRLRNNGTTAALPVLHAHEQATLGWTINYTIAGTDVTGQITAPAGLVVTDSPLRGQELVAPGASVDLVLTLTAPESPLYGSILLRAFWNPQDPSLIHRDAIRIDLYQPDLYNEWTAAFDWQAADAGVSADPDNDGLVNLMEYALGGDPLVYQPGKLPAVGNNGSFLTLSFDRIADPALAYTVIGSDELVNWAGLWFSTGGDNVAGRITVQDPVDFTTGSPRFLRLSITRE